MSVLCPTVPSGDGRAVKPSASPFSASFSPRGLLAGGTGLGAGGDPGWATAGLDEGAGWGGGPAPCRDPAPPSPAQAWGHLVLLGALGTPTPTSGNHPLHPQPSPPQAPTPPRGRRTPGGCRVPVRPGMMSPVAMAMLLHHCVAARPNSGISAGAAWRGQQDGPQAPRGGGGCMGAAACPYMGGSSPCPGGAPCPCQECV